MALIVNLAKRVAVTITVKVAMVMTVIIGLAHSINRMGSIISRSIPIIVVQRCSTFRRSIMVVVSSMIVCWGAIHGAVASSVRWPFILLI